MGADYEPWYGPTDGPTESSLRGFNRQLDLLSYCRWKHIASFIPPFNQKRKSTINYVIEHYLSGGADEDEDVEEIESSLERKLNLVLNLPTTASKDKPQNVQAKSNDIP